MCMAIYAALLALLLYYSNVVVEQFALSVGTTEGEWMVAAIGWEMLPLLWPLLLLSMVVASAATLLIVRPLSRRSVAQRPPPAE